MIEFFTSLSFEGLEPLLYDLLFIIGKLVILFKFIEYIFQFFKWLKYFFIPKDVSS
ncbi:MAG: hypothetical protein ACJAR4_000769 [Psychroserpens sp.]|jgi:hypothetical protein